MLSYCFLERVDDTGGRIDPRRVRPVKQEVYNSFPRLDFKAYLTWSSQATKSPDSTASVACLELGFSDLEQHMYAITDHNRYKAGSIKERLL